MHGRAETPRSRRQFLRAATLSTLAAAAPEFVRAQAAPSRTELRRTDTGKQVDLAIATICMDGFENRNFEPSFALLPELGFRNVEFNVWYPDTLTPSGIESIRRRCAAGNLQPICLQGTSFGASSGADLVKDVAHKLWLMRQARELGCRRVKFTGAKRGTQGGLESIIDSLKELAPAAEEMDVLILVENHANNNLENIADYDTLFAAIDSPHVGLCLDTGHFAGAAVDIDEVVERFHSRTLHVDLKDCIAIGTYKTVRFGEGVVDLPTIVEQLLARDYQGYLLVEQAPPIRPDYLKEDLSDAYQRFARYVR